MTIHNDVRVKKNSRRVFKQGNIVRNLPSKAYCEWEKNALIELKSNYSPVNLNYPVYCHYRIFRQTKRRCDLSNLIEGVNDVLQQASFIKDDSYNFLVPIFYSEHAGLEFDKENPRIVITLTDSQFELKRHTGC